MQAHSARQDREEFIGHYFVSVLVLSPVWIDSLYDLQSFRRYICHHRCGTKLLTHMLHHKQEHANTNYCQNNDHCRCQLAEIALGASGDNRHAVYEGEYEKSERSLELPGTERAGNDSWRQRAAGYLHCEQ